MGRLDMVVFNRSNDVVWGAYGANAVHFSFLLEYLARWIGCEVGTYSQISVNFHGYTKTLEKVREVQPDRMNYVYNPYLPGEKLGVTVKTVPLFNYGVRQFDFYLDQLLKRLDAEDYSRFPYSDRFFDMASAMFRAHAAWKELGPIEDRFRKATAILHEQDSDIDWIAAAHQWIHRRVILAAGHR
jgi:hypothetical protein